MAGPTRLELATSGVTSRRSNQTELRPRLSMRNSISIIMVGATGIEPVASGL